MERQTIQTAIGEIEYGPENRIDLPRGIPGFESADHALWVTHPEYEPVKWFILVGEDSIALPLLDPFTIMDSYTPEIPDEAVELLEAESAEDLVVYCVATPRAGQTPTVNLRSPVVINVKGQRALQVILAEEEFPIRYEWSQPEGESGAHSC